MMKMTVLITLQGSLILPLDILSWRVKRTSEDLFPLSPF